VALDFFSVKKINLHYTFKKTPLNRKNPLKVYSLHFHLNVLMNRIHHRENSKKNNTILYKMLFWISLYTFTLFIAR